MYLQLQFLFFFFYTKVYHIVYSVFQLVTGSQGGSQYSCRLICQDFTQCVHSVQASSFPGCSPPAAASHHSISLPVLRRALCQMQIPLGMAWDTHPSGAKELPEAAREGRRQQDSSSQRCLWSRVSGSALQAPLSLLAPWKCFQRLQEPNRAPGGNS